MHSIGRRSRVSVLLAATFLLLRADLRAADYVIHEKVATSAFMGQPAKNGTRKTVWSGNRMRVEEAGGPVMILRGDRRRLYFVDPAEKSYWEMSFDEMRSLSEQSVAMMSALGGVPGPATLSSTGEEKTVGSWPAKRHVVRQTGPVNVTIDVWVTDKAEIDAVAFREMSDLVSGETFLKSVLEELRKVPGFPVERRIRVEMMGNTLDATETVERIERTAADPSLFELPAGFHATPSPMAQMAAAAGGGMDAPPPASPAPAGGPKPAPAPAPAPPR